MTTGAEVRTVSAKEFYRAALDQGGPFPAVQHYRTGPPEAQYPSEGHGAVFHEEGCVLASIAYELGGPVLEIGAEKGISTRYIHEGLTVGGHKDKLYSVDIRHQWPEDANWPLRVRVERDSRFYRTPEPVRWAFIDGNHTRPFIMQDIEAAVASGAKSFLFHDTGPENPWPDPRKVVLEVFGDIADVRIWDIKTGCGLMYVET